MGGGGAISGATPWGAVAEGQSTEALNESTPDDVLYIGYTSGTTGRSRGVVLDHRRVLAGATLAAAAWRIRPYSAVAYTASFSFAATLSSQLWSQVLRTSTIVITGRFDLENVAWAVEAYGATYVYLPTPAMPAATELLRERPKVRDTLVSIGIGASPMVPSTLESLVDASEDKVLQGYGLTEGAGVPLSLGSRPDWDTSPNGWRTAGRVFGPAVFQIRDADGNLLPHDGSTEGEITVSSPDGHARVLERS